MEIGKISDGIVKLNINKQEYIVWIYTNVVISYIKEELKKRFPGKLIIRELNQIDLSIPEENLPIEIQSTPVAKNGSIGYTAWEGKIILQINQEIASYGNCWFFFDSELLRAMKNSVNPSMNLDWFRRLIKEEKLKVFTISYDGIIEEKVYKDFDFLSEKSQTCPVAAKEDNIILNRNKLNIFANVIKGYNFVQDEIDEIESSFYHRTDKDNRKTTILEGSKNDRTRLYGLILRAIGNLSLINELLNRNIVEDYERKIAAAKRSIDTLGIIEIYGKGGNNTNTITKFVDKFDICKYFPGYLRNKDAWKVIRGRNLNVRQFDNFISGRSDVFKGIDYYYNVDINK